MRQGSSLPGARRLIMSSVIGGSSNQVGVRNPTLLANRRLPPPSRSLATALRGARSRGVSLTAELHHYQGRDLFPLSMASRVAYAARFFNAICRGGAPGQAGCLRPTEKGGAH